MIVFLISYFLFIVSVEEKKKKKERKESRNVKHDLNLSLDDQRMRKVTPGDSIKKISCFAQEKRRI